MSDTTPDGTTPHVPVPPSIPASPQSPAAAPYPAPVDPPQYAAPPAYEAPPAYGATQSYVAAPGYGATQGYTPYPAPAKTNALAVISMIASIVGFIWILPFIGSVAGVIMGHISLRQIPRTGETGRGMALAGLIVGYVGLAFFVLGAIAFIFFISLAASQGSYYNS